MTAPTDFTLVIVGPSGSALIEQAVGYAASMTARNVLEGAFLAAQSPTVPDPFEMTITYFGESESPSFPGFLGYEVESLCHLPSNAQNYWELFVNGTPSQTGADTTIPPAGATVVWRYTPVSMHADKATTHAQDLNRRRSARRAHA